MLTDADFIIHSREPLNAEPRPALLAGGFITPQRHFYVRCHGAVPRLEAASHVLRVEGRVARPLALTVGDLRAQFPARTVVAALQCAGNRRAEMAAVAKVSGDPWRAGAIGNAAWSGVALSDVLAAAGAADDASLHVAFEGCDMVAEAGRRFAYAVSIPLAKAADVLLAFEMNGEPLGAEHGFPLRAVVPGYAGVRSAKWLRRIAVQDAPADTPVQREDYHLRPAGAKAGGTTIDAMPLNAAICEPANGATLPAGPVAVRGYAVASGRAVARVEVSGDGGRSWVQAGLTRDSHAPWGWTLWQAVLELPAGAHDLVARAWDSAGQTQPACAAELWNDRGYLCAAWHRAAIRTAEPGGAAGV